MKGYWHFTALSIAMSALTLIFNEYLFIGLFLIWMFYLFYTERLGKRPLLVSLICFMCFIVYIPSNNNQTSLESPPTETSLIVGEIISPISIRQNKIEFTLQESHSKRKILIIYFPNDEDQTHLTHYEHLKYGAHCTVLGQLEVPEAPTNPGQFNYQAFLANKGIDYQMIVKSLEEISCEGESYLQKLYGNRLNLTSYVNNKMNEEVAAWVNALVLGNDSYLSEETIELFQRWSLSHLLAISGLHVGLIVAIVYFILIKLTIVTKETAQWLVLILLPIYAFIAGGEPSVWRASLMVMLFIVFNKTKIKYSVLDTLSLVFIILILSNKYIVYHIGFQLSFIVTLGLLLSRRLLSAVDSNFHQILYVSFISQMMILPLQLSYFSTFQPLSILLNLLVVPYFSFFVIPLMILMVLLYPFLGFVVNVIGLFFIEVHDLFLFTLTWLDQVAYYPLVIGEIPLLFGIIYYALFFIFMKKMEEQQLWTSFKFGTLIVLLVSILAARPYLSSEGTVTMLDIGQGDAIIVELPYRKGVFLIDAGSGFSFESLEPTKGVYKQIIKPYLYSRGIIEIDAVILSHEHVDHIGSVSYLLEDFRVGEIIVSEFYEVTSYYETKWSKHGVPIKSVLADEEMILNDQLFHVLSPVRSIDANENSLVLYTELGGMYWLFTGDIYKSTEKEIINRYQTLPVDVLKVGHHGSDTSSDERFIASIKPTFALIPVGRNNRYGHPKSETIHRLEENNVTIMRTDEDGAIQFKFNAKENGLFYNFLP